MKIDRESIAEQIEFLTGCRNEAYIDRVIDRIEESYDWGGPAEFEIRAMDTLSGRPGVVYAEVGQ